MRKFAFLLEDTGSYREGTIFEIKIHRRSDKLFVSVDGDLDELSLEKAKKILRPIKADLSLIEFADDMDITWALEDELMNGISSRSLAARWRRRFA